MENRSEKMVGAVRFELTTSCTRNKRASQATLRPEPRAEEGAGTRNEMQRRNSKIHNFALCCFPPECFSQAVLGTILNAAAIVAGGFAGLIIRKQPSAATQQFFKVVLGACTVFVGLRLTVLSLSGSFGHILKQLGIVLLSLSLGN